MVHPFCDPGQPDGDSQVHPGTSYTHDSDLQAGLDYQWRVTPWNRAGAGPASPTWHFTTPAAPPAGTCNDAAFVIDITYKDNTVLQPGQSIDKVWRVRNTGTCSWGTNYRLAFDGGDQMGAPAYVYLPQDESRSACGYPCGNDRPQFGHAQRLLEDG